MHNTFRVVLNKYQLYGLLSTRFSGKWRHMQSSLNFLGKSKLFKLSKTEWNYFKYMKLAVKTVKHNHSFDYSETM